MSNTGRKAMTFRFREVVRKRLAELVVETGYSATRITEDRIMGDRYFVTPGPLDSSRDAPQTDLKETGDVVEAVKSRETPPAKPRLKIDPEKIAAFQRKMAKGKK